MEDCSGVVKRIADLRYVERDTGYRRYSYEPTTHNSAGNRMYSRGGAKKDSWLYQKTDPRRY